MVAIPKPERRKTVKRRRARHAARVVETVRAQVAARDGYCRLGTFRYGPVMVEFGTCEGPSEWAHLRGHRRSDTRGRPPEERHTTAHSAMLCKRHHGLEESGRLRYESLTPRGADGPMAWWLKDAPDARFEEAA